MKVRDIIAAVDEFAPPGLAYEWDRIGLQTGSPDDDATKVLVALSITRGTYVRARKAKADVIVSHHALIWDALKTLRSDQPQTRLALDIAQAGIACYTAHTNLDVARGGVNDVLAGRLGLKEVAPLFPLDHAQQVKLVTFVPETHLAPVRRAVCAAGAGVIGEYTQCSFSAAGVGTFLPSESADPFSGKKGVVNEEAERRFETLVPKARLGAVLEALLKAHPYEEPAYDIVPLENRDPAVGLGRRGVLDAPVDLEDFAAHVRTALAASHLRVAGAPKKRVRTVAVLGGSGGDFVERLPRDVDAYVTGDVKYHQAQAAEERDLAVIDAGHHATEKWIVPALAEYLKSKLDGVPVTTYDEPEPFQIVG